MALAPPVQPSARRQPAAAARRWSCLALAVQMGLASLAGPLPAAAAAQTGQVNLPALGESASEALTPSRERRIGDQIMAEIRRDPAYLDDALLLDHLQALWRPLVQAARQRGDIGADTGHLFPYEAFLVRDRSVNAFALPGGYVGVHLGLIALTATPDELASVLAHELSHVTQRHIARNVSAQSRSSTLGMAAMLLGLLLASRASNADAAQAVVMGGQAAMAQSQLNFSRDMEREADRTGHALLNEAGFSPAGMAGMFDKLDQSGRLNDNGAFPYLRSHPLTVDRISEARQRVESTGAGLAQPTPPLLHRIMQTRARVLMDSSVQSLRRWQELDAAAQRHDAAPAERIAALAGSALASSQLRDFGRADAALRAALQLATSAQPAVDADALKSLHQLVVQIAVARGDVATARQALVHLTADTSRSTQLLRAETDLADGSPAALRQGSDRLLTWVAEHRNDASAWAQLAQASERLGQPLRAVRAQAESEAALGNVTGAIDRLRAGQQLARRSGAQADFIEVSVIDARLRDLMAVRREQQADQREARGPGSRSEPDQ